MKTAIFKTTCLDCSEIFPLPVLSDFSYGEGIFSCNCGKVFAHYMAINHPVTAIFEILCQTQRIDKKDYSLFDFSAFVADNITGHKLVHARACPKCKSKNLSISINKEKLIWDIPEASYEKFFSLSASEIINKFEQFIANNSD